MSNNQQGEYLPSNTVVSQKSPSLIIQNAYWLRCRSYVGYVGVGIGSLVSVCGFLAARFATGAGWPQDVIKFFYCCATVSVLAVVFSVFLLAFFWWFPWSMRGVKKQVSADEYSQLLYLVRHWKSLVSQLFEVTKDPERNHLFPGITRVSVEGSQIFLELAMPRQRPSGGRKAYLENAAAELKNLCNFFEVKPDSRTYNNGKRARLLIVVNDGTAEARKWDL